MASGNLEFGNEAFSLTLSLIGEQRPPLRKLFLTKYTFLNCLKAGRERSSFNILRVDDAQVCRPIGLQRRQPGLTREERQIVNHGKREVTFGKQTNLL